MSRTYINVPFSDLKGKTLVSVSGLEQYNEEVVFITTKGERYSMYHIQDCCETVAIEDIIGDIADILNSEILAAEEVEGETPADTEEPRGSYTWTFYKLDTAKGGITIRWLGESNGYYSETVSFVKVLT